MKRNHDAKGQAILLVVVAMGLLLFGALGFAIDAGSLYFHRNMAQAAADASAMAAVISVFQGTNTAADVGHFGTSGFSCDGDTTKIPCFIASKHGFGPNSSDKIEVAFPVGTSPWLSSFDTPNQVKVTVTRTVQNTFMRMLGAGPTTDIKATATAGIVSIDAPIPILVLHPAMNKALILNGTGAAIRICGGPPKSIQINSSDSSAFVGNGIIDLSRGGPGTDTTGGCTQPHGNGSDFGVFGGLSSATVDLSKFDFGTTPGHYVQPSSPMTDPFCTSGVPATCGMQPPAQPPPPAAAPAMTTAHGCGTTLDSAGALIADPAGCALYLPGYYPNGINVGNAGAVNKATALFTPGLYYMGDNGFGTNAQGQMRMCPDCGTGGADFDGGMLVYNKYNGGVKAPQFDISGGGSVFLKGTPESGIWAGILFFQDHFTPNVPSAVHNIGGGGALELVGTMYITELVPRIVAGSKYQTIKYNGHPSSNTFIRGEIITDALELNGNNAVIQMKLGSNPYYKVRQVALVR